MIIRIFVGKNGLAGNTDTRTHMRMEGVRMVLIRFSNLVGLFIRYSAGSSKLSGSSNKVRGTKYHIPLQYYFLERAQTVAFFSSFPQSKLEGFLGTFFVSV